MRDNALRNEVNKIGLNMNQIVKNNNSHMYRDDDKIELKQNMCEIKEYIQVLIEQKI
ncbi:plasmid mobilization relaxosome protein MobC [bacterium 1xD42-62]|uniref:Plasmid mobilization relaxosome protein MobC n=1 Tax=Parablautia muri TaxID=2320879 RepID=A0A9X5GUX2_9FIRM|nr:plasmid mobilization relaxosome protein MobC [Parablautia muri]